MKPSGTTDLSGYSMTELFRMEAEGQLHVLTEGLLALEDESEPEARLEALMRAAHSIKGAARMVGAGGVVRVAHAMEDCLVAVQRGDLQLEAKHIDLLLKGVDLIGSQATLSDAKLASPGKKAEKAIGELCEGFAELLSAPSATGKPQPKSPQTASRNRREAPGEESEGVHLRVNAAHLTRLAGHASEMLVEARWLRPFLKRAWNLKRRQFELVELLDRLRLSLEEAPLNPRAQDVFLQAYRVATGLREQWSDELAELEEFDRRLSNIADRVHHEVLSSRMRPFADAVQGLPRLVRDMGRRLGKEVRLDMTGTDTLVDREVLERISVPLKHLVQNAVDHGVEPPEERERTGKPRQGTVHVSASHRAGMLVVHVSDDGRGVRPERLRQQIVQRGLATPQIASGLSLPELLEFLFLPGFTTQDEATEMSGRGVGLDVVHDAVNGLNGSVQVSFKPEEGMHFQLLLPLTLSIVRALVVEIGGEPFAFPLRRVDRLLTLDTDRLMTIKGAQSFELGGRPVPVAPAAQLLELPSRPRTRQELSVVVFGDRGQLFGVVVDRFVGERELAVHPLEPQIGKIPHVSAAAQLDDGTPTLILDVDDLVRTMENLGRQADKPLETLPAARKRVLLVDDSMTVREATKALLQAHGYIVDVAVDGVDGWNAVRGRDYELVITDVDMPRLDGFALIDLIRKDPKCSGVSVMILSYKGRVEDRRRGLEVGADYYLAKSDADDGRLLESVINLIGEPQE